MLHMNLPTILLAGAGCCLYIMAMSALGRWLAACGELSSTIYRGPSTPVVWSASLSLRS